MAPRHGSQSCWRQWSKTALRCGHTLASQRYPGCHVRQAELGVDAHTVCPGRLAQYGTGQVGRLQVALVCLDACKVSRTGMDAGEASSVELGSNQASPRQVRATQVCV